MYTDAIYLRDESGHPYGIKQANGKICVSAMPYLYDIAEGNITDHTPWTKFGRCVTVADTQKDMWAGTGLITFPSLAGTMMVISTSEADADGGSGLVAIELDLLNDTYGTMKGYATLNGTEAAEVTNSGGTALPNIFRVNSMRATSVGATGAAVGTVYLNDGDAVTYSVIPPNKTRASNIAYTVPLGKSLYITSVQVGWGYKFNSTQYGRAITQARQNPSGVATPDIWYEYTPVLVSNSTQIVELTMPTKILATVDIKVSILATYAGEGNCLLRGWLE